VDIRHEIPEAETKHLDDVLLYSEPSFVPFEDGLAFVRLPLLPSDVEGRHSDDWREQSLHNLKSERDSSRRPMMHAGILARSSSLSTLS